MTTGLLFIALIALYAMLITNMKAKEDKQRRIKMISYDNYKLTTPPETGMPVFETKICWSCDCEMPHDHPNDECENCLKISNEK